MGCRRNGKDKKQASALLSLVTTSLGVPFGSQSLIAGSALFLALLERFPWVVWAGGALLGWIAGGLLPDDAIISQYIAKMYGMPIVPSLWPDAEAISEFLSKATTASLHTDYSWLGSAGRLVFEFEIEPIAMICGILGAIFVVLMGLYLVRSSRVAEAEPAPST
jgi:hypothetical protein